DNEQIPGVLAFRVESPIVYFNVDHILRIVLERVEAEAESLRLIVCDLSTSPTVDLAGAKMFLDLHTELAKRQMILRLVEAHASVRDLLRLEGAEDRVDRFKSVDDVIEHFQKEARNPKSRNLGIVLVAEQEREEWDDTDVSADLSSEALAKEEALAKAEAV